MSSSFAPAPLPRRSVGTAYIFWVLLGVVGGHHFYLGNTARGLLYVFTLGLGFVGVTVDLFAMKGLVRSANISRVLGM